MSSRVPKLCLSTSIRNAAIVRKSHPLSGDDSCVEREVSTHRLPRQMVFDWMFLCLFGCFDALVWVSCVLAFCFSFLVFLVFSFSFVFIVLFCFAMFYYFLLFFMGIFFVIIISSLFFIAFWNEAALDTCATTSYALSRCRRIVAGLLFLSVAVLL